MVGTKASGAWLFLFFFSVSFCASTITIYDHGGVEVFANGWPASLFSLLSFLMCTSFMIPTVHDVEHNEIK